MATQVQNRRGTTAEHSTFTGANGELTVDTTKRTLVVHDGATAGGRPLLREDQSNLPTSAPTTGIYNASGSLAISTNGTGRLFVNASGLVGIGTTSPGVPLTVQADSNAFANDLIGRAADNTSIIRFKTSDNSIALGSIGQYGTTMNINSIGAGPIAFYTTNTESARIDSSGRLGVGTSSPTTKLHVADGEFTISTGGNASDNGGIINFGVTALSTFSPMATIQGLLSNAAGTELQGGLGFFTRPAGTAGQTLERRMTISSQGNVGIGTTSPGSPLEVNGEIRSKVATTADATVGAQNSVASFFILQQSDKAHLYTGAGQPIVFTNNNQERARIDSSGRLLVGTSSARETNTGNDPFVQFERSSGSALVLSATKNGADAFGPYFTLIKSRGTSAGANNLVSSGDELGSILFYGTDGTNPEAGAAIQAYVDGTPGTNDMPGRLVFSTTADGASSPTQALVIKNNQDVLCTTTTAATSSNGWYGMQIQSASGGVSISRNGSNVLAFFHTSNPGGTSGTPVGTISITTTSTAYSTSSDYRLKENVTPVTDGITRLQQLKPSRFNFIADPAKMVDGFLAHEVQNIVPEAITGEKDAVDDDGNPIYQGIDQSKLVPLLTAALQEAVAKIESLEARLTAAGI